MKKQRWIHDKAGAAGIVMLFCGFLYNFRTLINPGKWMVDSDMAAEMVLSDLLNKEGGILTRSWYYSTELHVFETQWFLRIGLLFYPDNWHRARMIGSLLILLVYSAAFYFMAGKLNLRGYALLGAAIVIWPFGRDYYYYGTWGLHYLPYMIFAFFALGLFLRYADASSGESGKGSRAGILACYLLGLAAAFMSGLNGIREALILYVPLLFSTLVMRVMEVRRNRRENCGTFKPSEAAAGRSAVCYSLCMLAGNIAGYLVNAKILARNYHFTSFGGVSWESDFPNTYSKILGDYLQMFGYQPGTEVFSAEGIGALFGVLLAFAVIASVLWLFLHFGRLSSAQRFILIFYVSALFIDINVYHFIDYYNPRYCVPLVPFGVLMVLIALETEPFVLPDSRRVLALILSVGIVVSSVATVREEAGKPRHGAEAYTQMVEWLEKNHIYSGYAGAWNTNVLTELSNGKIEMWTLNWNLRQKGAEPILPWLQKTDHETRKPEGRVFLLFDRVEDGAIENSQYYLDPSKKEFENGYFNIYVYDSADELLKSINSPKPEMETADAESAVE